MSLFSVNCTFCIRCSFGIEFTCSGNYFADVKLPPPPPLTLCEFSFFYASDVLHCVCHDSYKIWCVNLSHWYLLWIFLSLAKRKKTHQISWNSAKRAKTLSETRKNTQQQIMFGNHVNSCKSNQFQHSDMFPIWKSQQLDREYIIKAVCFKNQIKKLLTEIWIKQFCEGKKTKENRVWKKNYTIYKK